MSAYFAGSLIGLLLFGSCLVWWRVARSLQKRPHPLPYRERNTHAFDPLVVLLTLLLWLAVPIFTVTVFAVPRGLSRLGVQVSCLSSGLWLFLIFVIFVVDRRHGRADFGIDFSGWTQQLTVAVSGFLASVLPVSLVQMLTMVSGMRGPDQMHSFLKLLKEDPSVTTLIWIGIAVVILAPLAEEFVFRVILQGWLQTRLSAGQAITVVAVLFSAVHKWPDALPLFPLALILGYVYYRRHSLLAVYVLHALFNLSNLILAL